MQPIHRREWNWVALFTLFAATLVASPYVIALLRPPEGQILVKTLYYGDDLSQYLAAMGDGAASASWLVSDHLTSEAHSPALMYLPYVFLGKVASALGVPFLPVFSLATALALPPLVFAAYAFAATFADSPGPRRAATIVILMASGLGIWAAAVMGAGAEGGTADFSYDRAEVSTFLLPFGPPHLTLALALLLVWGRALAGWTWERRPRALGVLAAAVVGIGLLNSFTLATLVGLSLGYALIRWLTAGAFPFREAGAAVVIGAVAAPFLGASLLTFSLDPFWSITYGRQNTTGSPAPWTLAVDFGLLLPLAVVGALSPGYRKEGRALLVFWVLALLALMYLPVPFQRRFGFGLQPALAMLAGLGMVDVGKMLRRRIARLGLQTLLITGLFSGTILGYSLLLMAAGGVGPLGAAIFQPVGNAAAADWLASSSTEKDVVLASVETSNYLAGKLKGRVMVGHKAGTLDYSAKEALMRDFFHPARSGPERSNLAAAGQVTMVFVGEKERLLGAAPLRPEDGFRLVYDADGVSIFRVERRSPW